MEIKRKAEMYIVDYRCEKCKEGIMVINGIPRKGIKSIFFRHKCNKCGEVVEFENKQYPVIEYKRIEIAQACPGKYVTHRNDPDTNPPTKRAKGADKILSTKEAINNLKASNKGLL